MIQVLRQSCTNLCKMTTVQDQRSSVPGSIPLQSVESHWQNVFNRYDTDGDGRIPLQELCRMVSSKKFHHDIPERTVRLILHRADVNKDGYLNFPEFMQMLETHEGQTLFGQYLRRYIRTTVPPRHHRVVTPDALDGEYEDEYTCNPPAVCMLIVSIIEIAFFMWDVASIGYSSVDGPVAKVFIYDPHKRIEIWRFVTYMFVHVGVFHLAVNLVVQILLGIPLEMVHRWWRVLIVYVAGVVAGSLATSVSDPRVYVAGASGGVYALITAHLATIILNWSEMQFAVWQLAVFLILMIADIGTAVSERYIAQTEQQVAYAAHLAGGVAGLLVGLYVLRNLEVHSWERVLLWCAICVFVILITAFVMWNIFVPDYFPTQY